MQKEQIEESLRIHISQGIIYNQQFKDLRGWANRRVDKAYSDVLDEFRGRKDDPNNDDIWKVSCEFRVYQLSDIRSVLKKLDKYKKNPDKPHDGGRPYKKEIMEKVEFFVNEWKVIYDLFEEAKPLIVMGRKPSETPKVITPPTVGEGTCQICQRIIRLSNNEMIYDHGHTIGDGFRNGSCDGAGYDPYQKSCERTKEVSQFHKQNLTTQQKFLSDLKEGKVTKLFFKKEEKWITQEHSEWKRTVEQSRHQTESFVRGLESEIRRLEHLVKNWKLSTVKLSKK